MAQIPAEVLTLVERFDRNREAYQNQAYNETQLRQEFINPLFEALGWDVANKSGYAEAYKEVIHEDAIKIGGATKAPDYCFRIGGARKFFVEAKKPSVSIKENVSPAYQLRRYAWSAKLPLSILTDFEEFAVYDCRLLPKPSDKPSMGRILYLTYNDYADRWDEIETVFSRDAILKGSFDKYAESSKGKRGTAEVDKAFLKEIEAWREALARNLALRNPKLSVRDLNFSVQRTIDRVIFLRMCEDRGIEIYGELRSLLNGENTYKRLQYVYGLADDKYNSGLFHFKEEKGRSEEPDKLSLALKIDDKILKDIIRRLYYPESPYEFSVLSADILGNVYEQFLGKVIRLTSGHRAVVEEKPEVKKAGGVYYTPTYIVDYIVNSTVGKLCEDKNPKQLEKLKILDPACGSGSFLIGAYRYLLDYHRDWYVSNIPLKHTKQIYQGRGGQWNLTTQEKKRILLNNIYGVDIDSQAVEVTKLSLLLKVLEGESEETINKQLKIWRERALPDLGHNIKCGNSLIGPEYYERQQANLFNDEETHRVNAFNWIAEFPEIMKAGGFDVVMGNPPYVFGRDWQALNIGDDVKAYLGDKYKSSPYQLDLFSIFMEKACQLCRRSGYVGQIVPNVWLTNTYSSTTRAFILAQANNLTITTPPSNVFHGLTVDTVVYTFQRTDRPGNTFTINAMRNGNLVEIADCNRKQYIDGHRPISMSLDQASADLTHRLKKGNLEVQDFALVTRGVHPYRTGGYGQTAFGIGPQIIRDVRERPYHSKSKQKGYRPFIYGRDLQRFSPPKATEFLKYGPWLAEPRQADFFQGERVYSRKILGDRLVVTIEVTDSIADQQVYIARPKSGDVGAYYLGGVLGSRVIAFFIRGYYDEVNDAFPQVKVTQLKSLPIPAINSSEKKMMHDHICELVRRMVGMNKQFSAAKNPNDKTRLQREIDTADRQIDQLVYELYGLTEEEIKIVKEANSS